MQQALHVSTPARRQRPHLLIKADKGTLVLRLVATAAKQWDIAGGPCDTTHIHTYTYTDQMLIDQSKTILHCMSASAIARLSFNIAGQGCF